MLQINSQNSSALSGRLLRGKAMVRVACLDLPPLPVHHTYMIHTHSYPHAVMWHSVTDSAHCIDPSANPNSLQWSTADYGSDPRWIIANDLLSIQSRHITDLC